MVKSNLLQDPPDPKIYAYTTASAKEIPWQNGQGVGILKIGMTGKEDASTRVHEQTRTVLPALGELETVLVEKAIGDNGYFRDSNVHNELERMGRRRVHNEWFEATVDDVRIAINAVRTGRHAEPNRTQTFKPRPEQLAAIDATAAYFNKCAQDFQPGSSGAKKAPHFLWNAKMRFGKTFTTYQLAKKMNWKRVLVLTFKPAVQSAWRDDLVLHEDFRGWQFIGKGDTWDECVKEHDKPVVWFASFQDVLGKSKEGAIKTRLEEMWMENWDCVVLDEYHFGSWRDRAKELYDFEGGEKVEGGEFDEEVFPLTVSHYLYLSGTPFRSLAIGEFTEDQIFSWTYSDEQRAKKNWTKSRWHNPYSELPQMMMLTYQLPEDIRQIAQDIDADEFDLNEFFAATKIVGSNPVRYKFKHEAEVQKWLDILRGHVKAYDGSRAGPDVAQPPVPFENVSLRQTLKHTFWFLPSVASCHAMADLLAEPANDFYKQYKVIVAAGKKAGIGMDALPPVEAAMGPDPTDTKTITLSCGKLTTGVTIPPWSGIMMLRNTSSPETYFQAAFRVQSPWSMKSIPDPVNGGEVPLILKPTCYVFDFAPQRALRLLAEYATQVASDPSASMEEKVAEFLHFLPVLCFEGSSMEQLDAGPLLDFVATGTASTMLARQWQSARLIDMSKETFERLLANPEVIDRLSKLETFRNLRDLNEKLVKTINNDTALNKAKTKPNEEISTKERKELAEKEKESKSFRKELAENLKKLAARIPVFMYLTDEREETVKDVINAQGDMFLRSTGLTQSDFKTLCDIGVFNKATMDSAVFAFRRFELASLNYLGGGKEQPVVYGGMIDSYAAGDDVREGIV